jgi:hypothetical protein
MIHCPNCGIPIQGENAKVCPNCGFQLTAGPAPISAPVQPAATRGFDPGEQITKGMSYSAPLGLDRKTFFKKYSLGSKECFAAALIGYISAGFTTFFALTGLNDYFNIYSLVDVAIVLTLCLLIQLLRSRIASILLLVYAIASMMTMIVNTGTFGGWMGLIAGISAVVGSFQCAKEWKTYQARSQSPAQSAVPTL